MIERLLDELTKAETHDMPPGAGVWFVDQALRREVFMLKTSDACFLAQVVDNRYMLFGRRVLVCPSLASGVLFVVRCPVCVRFLYVDGYGLCLRCGVRVIDSAHLLR